VYLSIEVILVPLGITLHPLGLSLVVTMVITLGAVHTLSHGGQSINIDIPSYSYQGASISPDCELSTCRNWLIGETQDPLYSLFYLLAVFFSACDAGVFLT
jgi:hypothetical protein